MIVNIAVEVIIILHSNYSFKSYTYSFILFLPLAERKKNEKKRVPGNVCTSAQNVDEVKIKSLLYYSFWAFIYVWCHNQRAGKAAPTILVCNYQRKTFSTALDLYSLQITYCYCNISA